MKQRVFLSMILLATVMAFTAPVQAAGTFVTINEILADPALGLAGDANGDGVRDFLDDEFVEIVNISGADLDLENWELWNALGLRHVFPTGTIVPADCAIVVFGGGEPTGTFGDALVQTASTGSLQLDSASDTVAVFDAAHAIDDSYSFGFEADADQSLTLDPDIVGTAPMVEHSAATGSGGALFSPGTKIDGTSFSGCLGGDVIFMGGFETGDLSLWSAVVGYPGHLRFSSANYSGTEGDSVPISVERFNGALGPASVHIASGGGSAIAGSDYMPIDQILNWSDGESGTKLAVMTLIDDGAPEGGETVNLAIDSPVGAVLTSPITAVLDIIDND